MRFLTAIACAVALLGCAAAASAQTVSLQFNNGRVTLNAQNAPVRTILTEWSRLGGTRIVNADRIGGAPVTIELTDVTERQALDILLRTVAGYLVTERQEAGGVSRLGGVIILATSSAPRAQAPVTFGATTVQPRTLFDDPRQDADERPVAAAPMLPQVPAVVRVPGTTGNPTPVFQLETAQPPAQNAPQRPATTLQTLPGTSRPGEITPPPPQQPQR